MYVYPVEHYGFWRDARREFGVAGLLESGVFVVDVLTFAHCKLRVGARRLSMADAIRG